MNALEARGRISVRPYRDADRSACQELFDSNVPDYFAAVERKDFDAYLDDLKGPYFVMEDETGTIVACGGYAAEEEDPAAAVLCWGMVRRDLHRCGFGRQLLAERLRRIAAEPQYSLVTIETSQYSRGFFERFGFTAERVAPDGFAPGLDLVEMELDISKLNV
ncbi:GNAT family N-acetyltransferase [Paenibacillus dendritiformis]|uniref:N-acetyltransferase GCN5 n=1 Tax=Paenibacillus dendritiformis C454 TaxID=1131935 RepID=H3S9B6_9BACL|nr:GNAT family N-acetyltransferase [Paenibacillus dendritiformis]EHQ64364.1 N-acetyltransferase GCN5 [Paenibacillus dendritiformis C454]CAH8770422.1 GNAT family N-acetyltransferase [Paenibacillus dendritiformis]